MSDTPQGAKATEAALRKRVMSSRYQEDEPLLYGHMGAAQSLIRLLDKQLAAALSPLPVDFPAPVAPREPSEMKPMNDLDMLEIAWGLIANASRGRWSDQPAEWVAAAERWRDLYHQRLKLIAEASVSEGETPA